MADTDWIERLLPHEAETTLTKITEAMAGGMSAKEAHELHKLQKALKAKAGETYHADD